MDENKLAQILSAVPEMVSDVFYTKFGTSVRRPSFVNVYAGVKKEIEKQFSLKYDKIFEKDKQTIRSMAEDAYYGMVEYM